MFLFFSDEAVMRVFVLNESDMSHKVELNVDNFIQMNAQNSWLIQIFIC